MQTLKDRLRLLVEQEKTHIANRGTQTTSIGSNYYAAILFNIAILYVTLKVLGSFWPEYILARQDSLWHIYYFVYQAVIWVVHGLNYLAYGLIDHYGWLSQYKITKVMSLILQTNLIWDVDPEGWKRLRNKALILNFINLAVLSPAVFYLDSKRTRISFSPEVPSFLTVIFQIYVCMFIEAIFFYFFHRISHEYLYKFHKIHHEFVVPSPLAANYNHPIDYFVGTLIPFTLGPKLFGGSMHFLTFLMWGIWRLMEGYEGHSNYEFPWSPLRIIPFSASSEFHSFHHTNNVGNFGSTMIIEDTLTATDTEYFRRPNVICYKPLAKTS